MFFSCPKCSGALTRKENSFICQGGHSYDIARAGYINLLPPSGKSVHGDNKEMIAARRDFLNTGHYLPLAKRVSELAVKYFSPHCRVIDIGCGEGYYTDIIESALFERDGESRVSAFDISKNAVKFAALRNKRISFAVASAYHVPSADGVFSAAVNMFSPLARDEIYRILNTGGIFIMVFPAEEHLFGLKAAIYDTPYKNVPGSFELEGFELVESERISYALDMKEPSEIQSLFMMTPYAYRTSAVGRERVLSLERLTTRVDFYICVYKKI